MTVPWSIGWDPLMRSIGNGKMSELQNIPTNGVDIDSLKRALRLTTVRWYKDEWENYVEDTEKYLVLQTYIKFKANLSTEPYHNLVTVPKYRQAISQVRVSSFRLGIETGCHLRPPIPATGRICKYCHFQNIDDELHFITKCDFHAIEWSHLYDNFQNICPKLYYHYLFTSNSCKVYFEWF